MWQYVYTNELYHYGVKGMKWGVRKSESVSASNKSSTSPKMNLQLFGKLKSLKTVKLKTEEYARVMSEIHTNITKKEKESPIIVKAIGNYYYTFENHFDDTYKVVGKNKIPQSTTKLHQRNKYEP